MAPPAGHRPGPSHRAKGAKKKRSRFFPHNPLKTFDSDERIQGNPRKSNPDNQGFSQQKGPAPRKPKPVDRTNVSTRS
jgi:hypothetical protein